MKNLNLLPTDKPSVLGRFIDTNNLFLRVSNDIPRGENVNIFITSDEDIKEGEYQLYNPLGNFDNAKVSKAERLLQNDGRRKKIILTTDPDLIEDGVQATDDEFLEWFVKNPNCEQISIEEVYFHWSGYYKASELSEREKERCSLIKEYKIIIPKEELNYNVKQIKKNSLKDTQFEHELQARIYEVLKKNNNSSIEFQSGELIECVTEYFNHIKCTFIINDGDKTNVKKGKLV